MVRSFDGRPIPPELVDHVLQATERAPSAGNTRGTAWVALEGPETARYWELTTTEAWRRRSRRWPGLSRAPVVLLSLTCPGAYVARYRDEDKAPSDLGAGPEAWPVPYWFGDAAFETMIVLLKAAEAGLGACVLGAFRGERELLDALAVPEGWRLFAAVLLGAPDGGDHPSRSLLRSPPRPRLHRGSWGN